MLLNCFAAAGPMGLHVSALADPSKVLQLHVSMAIMFKAAAVCNCRHHCTFGMLCVAVACKRARCTVDARYSTTLHGADLSTKDRGLPGSPVQQSKPTNQICDSRTRLWHPAGVPRPM